MNSHDYIFKALGVKKGGAFSGQKFRYFDCIFPEVYSCRSNWWEWSTLHHVMPLRRSSNKPLTVPMTTQFCDANISILKQIDCPCLIKVRLWLILTFIAAWTSNHMPSKVWNEITYPFPNFHGCTIEVWEWIRNFIPHFIMIAIIYRTCWHKVYLRLGHGYIITSVCFHGM